MGLSSLYFVWIGGLALAAWALGRVLAKENSLRSALLVVALPALMALILLAPWLYWFVRASAAANAPFFGLNEISQWDASLNSLPIPSPLHPYLGGLARVLYSGPANEPGLANFGLLAAVLAILGLGLAWRDRRWLPPILLALTGLILALGLTLKWNGEVVQWAPLRPLDRALWGLGHVLKPGTFGTPEPPAPFDSALPLPGWLLAAIVPFWERARVFARYALVASVGVFLLAGLAISRLRWRWVSVALAGLLLFEVLPAPTASYPFPLRPHPAFEWLATQTLAPGEGVIDLGSWQPGVLFMPIGGETLWATEFHGKPTVAGASSVLPAHVAALSDWLATHSDPFGDPAFLPLLRSYKVRYILFHVSEGPARDALAEARANPALAGTRCFEPAPGPGPWDYPICIMDLESSTG